MIVFQNPGVLDIRAVKTFGVSSKEDRSTAIGYFGTGLKYAIAILLREGCQIKLITGGKHYLFGVSDSKIRNDVFNIVTMNDEELAFTTELGKNWELWQAFRELYSNMLDEKGESHNASSEPDFDEDKTYIIVRGSKFEAVYKERDKYFLPPNHDHLVSNNIVEVLPHRAGDFATLYYRGIRVSMSDSPALYSYNFLNGITLTEDRTIKSTWSVNYEIARLVLGSKDEEFISQMVMASKDYHEAGLNFSYTTTPTEGDSTFLKVVGELRDKYKDTAINPSAITYHKKRTKKKSVLPTESIKLNSVETQQLDKALNFLKNSLELNINEFPLIVCEDLGSDTNLGRADMDNNIMYVSKQCFREGTKRLAVALVEEYTHCKHRVYDETVEQKWVYLNQIVSLGERIQGEPL